MESSPGLCEVHTIDDPVSQVGDLGFSISNWAGPTEGENRASVGLGKRGALDVRRSEGEGPSAVCPVAPFLVYPAPNTTPGTVTGTFAEGANATRQVWPSGSLLGASSVRIK